MIGKITLLFNNKVHEVNSLFQQKMTQAQSALWYDKCLIAKDILSNQQLSLSNLPAIEFLTIFGKNLKAYSSSIQDQSQLAQRLLQDLRGDLKRYGQVDIYATLTRILEVRPIKLLKTHSRLLREGERVLLKSYCTSSFFSGVQCFGVFSTVGRLLNNSRDNKVPAASKRNWKVRCQHLLRNLSKHVRSNYPIKKISYAKISVPSSAPPLVNSLTS